MGSDSNPDSHGDVVCHRGYVRRYCIADISAEFGRDGCVCQCPLFRQSGDIGAFHELSDHAHVDELLAGSWRCYYGVGNGGE